MYKSTNKHKLHYKKRCITPIICVRHRLGRFAGWRAKGSPRVRVSGAVQMTAVQREPLRAPTVRATVQLSYALQKVEKGEINTKD